MTVFNKKKIKDFFIYGIGQAINIVSPLFVMPFIIYKCGQENFGKIGVGMSLALILNGIMDYGSYINGVKDISINRKNKELLELKFKSIYYSKFILLIFVLILISIMVCFIPFFKNERHLYFYSFFIVIAQFINPIWFFQGTENFKWISIVNLTSKSVFILMVFNLVNLKSDYIYVNFYLGIGAITGNTIGLIYLLKKHNFNLKIISIKPAIAILKEELNFSLSQVFLSLYQFSPIILISYFGGNFMAGQYRVIDQIITLFKTYLNMFFYFVYANICFELNSSVKKGIKIWKQYNGANFFLLLFVISLFFWKTALILKFLKIDASQLLIMTYYFRSALIVPILISISQSFRQLIFGFSENKNYIKITIITTICNFILIILSVKTVGLIGVFLSFVLIEIIIISLYCILLNKHLKNNSIPNE